MPTASRDHVVRAVVRLVADGGVEAATVRRVATELGVSIGMVQHHFPTKDAMLRAAMDAVDDAYGVRVARTCADRAPGEALRALVHEMLPLDPARAVEGRVWLAFVARAAVDPATARRHAEGWQELEDVLATLLARHRERATEPVGPADRTDARLLLAVVDGLAVGGLVEDVRLAPARVVDVADAALERLLDSPTRSSDGDAPQVSRPGSPRSGTPG